jgi:hypothetical protein
MASKGGGGGGKKGSKKDGVGGGLIGVCPLQESGRTRDDEVLRAVSPRVVLQRGVSETTLEKRRAQGSVWAGGQRFPAVW